MSYTTGEAEVKVKVESQKKVTIDDLIAEAAIIWSVVRSQKVPATEEESLTLADQLMTKIRREHPEFCESYPIVNRYMCQMRQYCPKAFRAWLGWIQNNPWKTEEGYLDAQAEYVTRLFKSTNRRANASQVASVRKNIRNLLQCEHDTFKKYNEDFTKEVSDREAKLAERTKNELKDFVKLIGAEGMSKAETIRVESCVDGTQETMDGLDIDVPARTAADDLLGF